MKINYPEEISEKKKRKQNQRLQQTLNSYGGLPKLCKSGKIITILRRGPLLTLRYPLLLVIEKGPKL